MIRRYVAVVVTAGSIPSATSRRPHGGLSSPSVRRRLPSRRPWPSPFEKHLLLQALVVLKRQCQPGSLKAGYPEHPDNRTIKDRGGTASSCDASLKRVLPPRGFADYDAAVPPPSVGYGQALGPPSPTMQVSRLCRVRTRNRRLCGDGQFRRGVGTVDTQIARYIKADGATRPVCRAHRQDSITNVLGRLAPRMGLLHPIPSQTCGAD